MLLSVEGNLAPPPSAEKIFNIGIFRKNASKYTKVMVAQDVWDNLNQIYRLFSFLTKNSEYLGML